MPVFVRALCVVSLLAAGAVASAMSPAGAKDFTFSDKANERIAKRLNIPVYFALPPSARGAIGNNFETSDILVDFKHPDAPGVGLRVVETPRAGMSKRLGKSGIFQTGDLLLSFRSEWGGAGAYPNIQMGISHTGVAYIKDGELHNIDNPLNADYLGSRLNGDLTSLHYKDLKFIHVVRPRGLNDADRANILAWATRLTSGAKRVYPTQIKFNDDYTAPKYKSGRPVDFVQRLGQIGLGQNPPGTIDMFCSEFAWSLLSLRKCDPAKTADEFKGSRVPSCIATPMKPMEGAGDYISRRSRASYAGLADGPLMVIDTLKLPDDREEALLKSIFVANPAGLEKMSEGHRKVAQTMQPKFAKLEDYYIGITGGALQRFRARLVKSGVNASIQENYSPTSFLINTLLPADNANRTMDYVATIVIVD